MTPRSAYFPPNRKRLKTAEQGYGGDHQKLRRLEDRRVQAGGVPCGAPVCLVERDGGSRLIRPGEAWDLGHDRRDRSRYTGPEHRRCNRATALKVNQRRLASREW